jgi:signal transduction histidine kinase
MSGKGRSRWQRWRRSLGMRLVALFVLLALAMAAVFLYGMQRALSDGWSGVLRPLIADYVDRLADGLGSPPDPVRAEALVRRLPLSVRIDGPALQWDSHPRRWPRGHDGAAHDDAGLLTRTSADGHRISFGLGGSGWTSRPRAIGWLTLGALMLLIAAAYGVVRHMFRPLDDIRSGAERFGRAQFDTPIPVRRDDELGELAGQVNTMARDIRAMLDAKRDLLLAVSHELRSPLTRARLNAELVPAGAARDALLRDLAAMRDLVTELLESERLAGGHAALQRQPTEPNALVRELVREHFTDRGVELALADGLPSAELDPARIRLALRNLLDNALRHSRDSDRAPQLASAVVDGQLCLSVRDFGAGVDEAQLGRLADAFYRVDTARQRSTGGIGLGLYLCRMVAQAHGGSLQLRNARPGLEATLRLPLPGDGSPRAA